MGRKKKPENIKRLQGTLEPSRDNPNKPALELSMPEPPAYLTPKAKELFNELAEDCYNLGVISDVDGIALGILAQAFADYIYCMEILNKHGHTYVTEDTKGNKVVKKRPEAEIASAKAKFVTSKLSEFGLTPSSRESISKLDSGESGNPLEDLLNGN